MAENPYYRQLQDRVKVGKNVFIAHTAIVIGDVELGDFSSVWYGAVVRADFDRIRIGNRTNVQEGVVMHVDKGKPIEVGNDVIIGHGAMIHGCTIGDACLIGMRATVMNGAKIGKGCIIGAGALVTENTIIPDFSMVLGMPAKVTKTLPEQVVALVEQGAAAYIAEASRYLAATEGMV